MTQLSDRLQGALGDAFKLERELKPGGMSLLFLATERSLNRRVVIKLLPPDMTSEVSAARFKQEIELAAQLQHPNILPILSAGSHDDLIYYVMPFISGESLRHRLINEGRTSVESARQIIREVADALAYAHGHGIVHRDIKPENILLEEGHAVLTDFGVARAIGEARGDDRLTATGMGVGTPGYMAPEQAAGERHVDARADVYALAVVAYEMLAGAPPFEGDTPQAVLAAHLTQDPSPVKDTRADTPAEVDAAIAKALAKRPEDRWQTAAEFRDAMAPAVSGARQPIPRRWVFAAGAAAVVLLIGALALWPRGGGFEGDPRLSLVVFPFENRTGDPDNDWLEEASMNLVGLGMAHWEELRVFDDERTASLMRRNDIAGAGDLDFDAAQAMAREAKVGTLVMGDIRREGDSLAFEAKIHDVPSGDRLETQIVRVAASADPRVAFDSLTARILHVSGAPLGDRPGAIAQTTASLEAYRAFLAGAEAMHKFEWGLADSLLRSAIEADTTFALAYVQLMLVGGWSGGGGVSAALAAKAQAHAADLPPRLRALVEFHAAFANDQFARARDIAGRLIARDSSDIEAWYQFGEAHVHHRSGFAVGRVPLPHADSLGNVGKALRVFQRTLALDSTYTIAYWHTVTTLGDCGNPMATFVCLADSALYGSTDELAAALTQPLIDSLRAEALEEQIVTAYAWVAVVPNDRAREELASALINQDRYDEAANQAGLLGGADAAAKAKAYEAMARLSQRRFREAGELAHEALAGMPDSVEPGQWTFGAVFAAIASGRIAEGRDAAAKMLNEFPGFPPEFPLVGVMVPKELLFENFAFGMVSSSPDSGLLRRSADRWADHLTEAFGRDTASINTIVRGIEDGVVAPSPYLTAYLGSRDTTVLLQLLDVTGPDDWPSGRAHMALARGDTAGARTLLAEYFPEATIESAADFIEMYAWAGLLARLGDTESALAAYQQLDSARLSFGPDGSEDPLLLIQSWAERGALYQQLGQRDEAIEMYEKLIDAWRDGDQHVQPSVERARRSVRVLRGEVEVGEPEVGS